MYITTVANKVCNIQGISPLQYHYYQPMWTLVGGGVKTVEDSRRKMADFMPPQADWLKTSVTGFRPDENAVETADGSTVKYDYLIVAVGLKVAYEKVRLWGSHVSHSFQSLKMFLYWCIGNVLLSLPNTLLLISHR